MQNDGHFKKALAFNTSSLLLSNGTQLNQVASYKYLGVTITSNLSYAWLPHNTSLCNKARKLVGMIYRKF